MWQIIKGSLQERLPYQAAYSRLIKYKNDSFFSPIDTITILCYDNGTFEIRCNAKSDASVKRLKQEVDRLVPEGLYEEAPWIQQVKLLPTASMSAITLFLHVLSHVDLDVSDIISEIIKGIQEPLLPAVVHYHPNDESEMEVVDEAQPITYDNISCYVYEPEIYWYRGFGFSGCSALVSNSVFSPVTTTKPQETYCGFKPGFLK